MPEEIENENQVVEEGVTDAAVESAEDESQAEPATNAEAAEVVEAVRETADATDDDFFTEEEVAEAPAVDPTRIVTIQTTSSQDKYVEVEGPTPVVDLIHKAGLQFAGDFNCILNGAEIPVTTVIPGGSTVTIVGKVKGG